MVSRRRKGSRTIDVISPEQERQWFNRNMPEGSRASGPSLLDRLMVRAGAVPQPMPQEVRVKAPKRVQEAMEVLEDYVASLDEKGGPGSV